MTRSEIPQLEVVTAIPEAENEDYLSQLLFSQGWNIIYRAFDAQSLQNFMRNRGTDLRTVVVYQSELPGFSADLTREFSSPTITFINLDGINFTSHEIMATVRGNLRSPMLQSGSSSETTFLKADDLSAQDISERSANFETFPKERGFQRAQPTTTDRRLHRSKNSSSRERVVIAVTGSTGAPGRTRFATAIAVELSCTSPVLFVDADIRSQGVVHKHEAKTNSKFEVVPLDREKRPTQIPDGEETAVVDLGVLPGIAEAINDRRWHGSLVNNVLDRATHLIYLCKSTHSSIAELTQFLREYPLLQKRLGISYVCVLTGHSRELREWESKFLTLTMGENRYVLREGQLETSEQRRVLGAIGLGNPKRKEIAKIAASLA